MAGFPQVPRVNGDTDDDASIHLYNIVGKASPLEDSSTIDDKIKYYWNQPVLPNHSLKSYYTSYSSVKPSRMNIMNTRSDVKRNSDMPSAKTGKIDIDDSDYDSEDTRNDDIDRIRRPNESLFRQLNDYKQNIEPKPSADATKTKNNNIHKNPSQSNSPLAKYLLLSLVAFVITLLFLFYPLEIKHSLNDLVISNKFSKINSKINKLENQLSGFNRVQSDLNNFKSNINEYNEHMTEENQKFKQQLLDKFNSLNDKLRNIQDFRDLKVQFDKLSSIDIDYLKDVDSNLQNIQKKFDQFDNLKAQVLQDLYDHLPESIPVYIKDNKIHIIPEFHKYLFNFIDSYYKSANLTSFKTDVNDNSSYKYITRDDFETLIKKRLMENNQHIYEKVNNVIDNLNVNVDNLTTIERSTNTVFLNELLDIFNKGSIKTNYADFNLGSRILGFLTNLDLTGKRSQKSVFNKMVTGWFDYFGSGSSEQSWRYNANNVLLDRPWQCQSNECSIGIRLSQLIIVTDIFVKSDNLLEALLFIKPKRSSQIDEIKEYITKFQIDETKNNRSKYTKKFFKVKTVISNQENSSFIHIKVPISLINLRIPCKDIYLEFKSKQDAVEMSSVKVYGITEFNSYKYNQEFSHMLNTIQDGSKDTNAKSYEYGFEDVLLGEDDQI